MKQIKILMGALILTIASVASAQESLLDYVVESCETELVEYCSTVTPGDGRLLLCMAAHEDKISTQCAVALYQASAILQDLIDTIAYLADSCATDIETHCSETPMGEGRLLMCLEDNADDLTDSCSTAIAETVEVE